MVRYWLYFLNENKRFADELNVQYGESSFQHEQLEGHSCCHLLNCKCF